MSLDLGPVLNPDLVRALRRFGPVSIGNEGQAADITITHKVINEVVRKVADVRHWGEYYRINCPLCDDTRRRLNICHLWGTADPVTGHPMVHLLRCQNEDCFDDRDSRHNLTIMLFGPTKPPQVALPGPVSGSEAPQRAPESRRPIALPDGFISVADPSCPDQAKLYLEGRGFDIAELAVNWDVGYSPVSQTPPPNFSERIVIPVYDVVRPIPINKAPQTFLAGWQARRLGDRQPKYLFASGMPKTQLLYGLPQALGTLGPIVVVEGVTDVWRLGSHAVAIFGKELSRDQLNRLAMFDGRPLVVFLDHGADAEAQSAWQQVRAKRTARGDKSPVVIAEVPQGRDDVGECSREEAWAAVARALGSTPKALARERKSKD